MPQFDTDRRAVLERMREANVTQAVIVATEEREIELVEALAKDQEGLFTAFAVSPQDETLPELTAEEIAQRMLKPKMVAVGETGLDYHYCHEPLIGKEGALAHISMLLRLPANLLLFILERLRTIRLLS